MWNLSIDKHLSPRRGDRCEGRRWQGHHSKWVLPPSQTHILHPLCLSVLVTVNSPSKWLTVKMRHLCSPLQIRHPQWRSRQLWILWHVLFILHVLCLQSWNHNLRHMLGAGPYRWSPGRRSRALWY